MSNDNSIPYVFVPISKNQVTIVDADMAEYALSHTWSCRNGYASRCPKKGEPGFARGSGKCGKLISLHAVVVGCPEGQEPDHINRNRLDNRRANVRCATRSQNMANKAHRKTVSGYRGVRRQTYTRKDGTEVVQWVSILRKDGEYHYCGCHANPEDAAAAHDRTAVELFGDFAVLNFPEAQ